MQIPKNLLYILFLAGCASGHGLGEPPAFTPTTESREHAALLSQDWQSPYFAQSQTTASLWSSGKGSLLGERRALARGDLLTVVISIDDSAEISNSSRNSRNTAQEASLSALYGLPENLTDKLPPGSSLSPGLELSSSNQFSGAGSVRRNERITLRVAATVIRLLPNGVFEIEGSQEVRINSELRELTVTGFVRPADISRQNEIQYDRIASARISYGGRGQISANQSPPLGAQILERMNPF